MRRSVIGPLADPSGMFDWTKVTGSMPHESVKTPGPALPPSINSALNGIQRLNGDFERRYKDIFRVENLLTRSLVSFQGNKNRAVYRWFKYKEAFSAALVERLLDQCGPSRGVLLDPFAGSGTALFAATALGTRAEGIEMLPICQSVIATKQLINSGIEPHDVQRLALWSQTHPWNSTSETRCVNELRITRGAYPPETMAAIGRYLAATEIENKQVSAVLVFALLCVLEAVSYTRKDGQYLRWDYRSGRPRGKKTFDKGPILKFDEAVAHKLAQIVTDLQTGESPEDLFAPSRSKADIHLYPGSCLEVLPNLPDCSYDCIITSPPYCNRYDYTRTYALELAMLGVDEAGLTKLRQGMLSCTVENRTKDLLGLNPKWQRAINATDQQPLLQAILAYLDKRKEMGLLNNTGIPRMVRGYFYEMACVIAECGRVLSRSAPLFMVNDNVRYAGASISVDIILSELAKELGFNVERILILPNGKGNSSQQMGEHGRDALRKCVYVWRKD